MPTGQLAPSGEFGKNWGIFSQKIRAEKTSKRTKPSSRNNSKGMKQELLALPRRSYNIEKRKEEREKEQRAEGKRGGLHPWRADFKQTFKGGTAKGSFKGKGW